MAHEPSGGTSINHRKRERERKECGGQGKKNDQEALSAVQGLENFVWVLLLPWVDSL